MDHFSAPKAQGDFHLIALFEKPQQIAQLHLVIVFIRAGSEFDLFDLNDFLLQPCIVGPFLLLVLKLAVVHELADWRLGLGCYLDQIDFGLIGHADCFWDSDDAKGFVINSNQPDFGRCYFTVDAMRTFCSDYSFPYNS